MFKITRIYSDADGESHFADFDVHLKDNGDIGFLSEDEPVKSIVFREVLPYYNFDFHSAPDRQYIVLLDGGVEIETSLVIKENSRLVRFYWSKTQPEKGTKLKISKMKPGNRYS